jgi:hypothetical protein
MTRPKEFAYIENGVVVDSNGQPLDLPPGSGVSRFADLTDRATADIPATNTPLAAALAGKQNTLVSGTNIKTVNGQSVLGSGNIAISGGSSYPEVLNFAALPAGQPDGTTYVVLQAQGVVFVNRRSAGLYRFSGGVWVFLGELPDGYFTDNVLKFYDDADPTKQLAFQLSGISSGQTRTLTIPDASGTIALTSQFTVDVPVGAFLSVTADRAVTAGDNNMMASTGVTSRLFTVPAGLPATFIGFSVSGPCTFAFSGGAVLATEDRPTGKGYSFCQLIRISGDNYLLVGART